MRYLNTILGIFFAAVLIGCNSSSADDNTTTTPNPASVASTQQDTVPVNNVPATEAKLPVTTPTTTPATGPGLNPAHGQPGHRCDIAEGAPLNSKPASNTITPSTSTITPSTATITPNPSPISVSTAPAAPAATATKSTAGLNPAHGQPGHRCEIAVGAPLDSKPAAGVTVPSPVTVSSATQPAPANTVVQQLPLTPVDNQSKTGPVVTPAAVPASGAGLNPAHGQPGHRCDIAVGAPLNSAPKKN